MDFLWFWVSIGVVVEVVRQTYKHCVPKVSDNRNTNADDLTEPLLQDGKCPFSCCAAIEVYKTDTGASSSDYDEADEIVSSEEIEEEDTESLIDKRKGKHVVEDDGMHNIVGTIYPSGPGCPKVLHFKVSDDARAQAVQKEASAKVHPQPPHGTVDQADAAMDNSSSKDIKQCVASPALSEEHRLLPPIHEVMQHGNIPEGDEIQPAEGQCSSQVD